MFRNGLLLAALVVAMAGWAVPVQADYFFDIWGVSADGSMDMSGGYSNGGSTGQIRLPKGYQFMTFLAFNAKSDGPDKHPQGTPGDTGDGVPLTDWLIGKKAFGAALYFRNATDQTCDPMATDGAYLNDPVTVLGFRCANDGEFIDQDHAVAGSGDTYNNPSVGRGDMAPPGWRMGQPNVFWPSTGKIGYAQAGDINIADSQAQYYKVSGLDSLHAGQQVKVGQPWFGTTGYGGYSTNAPGLSGSGRWAFDWLVEKSDAMMVNSSPISEADCTGTAGELEPRDLAGDGNIAEGWFAKHIDRCLINALVSPNDSTGVIECKGLVLHSAGSAVSPAVNTAIYTREQSGGVYAPYLAITATYLSDIDNDGCPDVIDLLWFVQAFGADIGEPWWNPDCDLNCDGAIDVVDLLMFVEQFGLPCLDS